LEKAKAASHKAFYEKRRQWIIDTGYTGNSHKITLKMMQEFQNDC
jgi:hypothetical protein